VNARANDDGTGGSGLPGLSRDALPGHPPLRDLPLTVLVGVTGVGKSTALAALGDVRVLPDRREVTDAVMPGVVSLPHGFGHGRNGARLEVAAQHPGVSYNDLADPLLLDELTGNAAVSGVPVTVQRAGTVALSAD